MNRISSLTVKKRIVTVFICVCIFFGIVNVRLAFVQFIAGDEIKQKANESWTRDIVFEAERGNILDKDGVVLAENVTAPSVIVVPAQVEDPENTASELAKVLDISEQEALEEITKKASNVRIHPEGRKITGKQEKALQKLDLPGVFLAKDSKRHYPFGDYLAHVLGFAGVDNQGLMGLESYYDDRLQGSPGSLSYYSDAKGGRIKDLADEYHPPEDGQHLETTIDSKVQTIIERELDLAVAEYNPDQALAVAVNPKTGGVVGMSSRPDFNPDNYQEADPDVYDRNLPIWGTFEPGSTFKIMTLASALEEDSVDLQEDTYHDTGDIEVEGSHLHCWKSGGHGEQTFLEVAENSCNPGFVKLGQKLGKEKLFSYIKDFGFGRQTGIDLDGEGTGILFQEEDIGPVEAATTTFGQGVSVTPIQQVMAVSAAINGGYLYEPHIAKEWIDPRTDETVETVEPNLKKQVISKDTSKEVRDTLESVVANGTGRPAYVDGYRVGGKTGTAQKVGEDGTYMENNYVVSFIGFAPADDPELVVYVAIDNPKDTVQFGGLVVGPIVGTIIEDSLRALDVEPRDDGLEKEYQWPEEPKVEVPELIGKNKQEMQSLMTDLKLETNGNGNTIIDQEPEAGTKLEQGETVRIYLSDSDEKE